MELSNVNEELLSSIENRHRKEKKELQAQIQALKKAAKNDKTKKKELLQEIARLEISIEDRHKQELDVFQKENHAEIDDSDKNVKDVVENGVAQLRVSKAQKRRDKKSQQEKDRDEQIKLQEKENLHGPRHKETQEIIAKLKKKNLGIFTIPSDGDCLYNAVAHQLLLKRDKNVSAGSLRKNAAEYLRQHKDDFLPFMTHPETYDMLNDNEFEEYCNNLENTNVWGGQLEIRALSSSLKCPISVIQATGPDSIEQGTEFAGLPLVITYHRHMYGLGEHFNSTCNKDGDETEN